MSLGSLFQCKNVQFLSVKKCFLISSLNLSWLNFEHSHLSYHWIPRIDQNLFLHFPFSETYREQQAGPSSSKVLGTPLRRLSPFQPFTRPFTIFVALFWIHSSTFQPFLNRGVQKHMHDSRWAQSSVKYSMIKHLFLLAGYDCVCGYEWLWLQNEGARAHCWLILSCCQPAPPDPFLQGYFPSTPFPDYTYVQYYSVPSEESSILTC